MRTVRMLSSLLVALTACGGAVETSPSTESAPERSALGLWIAPPSDTSTFLPLDVCADGTVSFDLPADPSGVRARCTAVGGSYESQGGRAVFVVGSLHLEGIVGDEGALLLASPERDRLYYRASQPSDIAGTFTLRSLMSPATAGEGAVTMVRTFHFDRGEFTFDNVLSREGTEERWSTVEHGTYAVGAPGDVVLTTDGQASHLEHVVVFGARSEYLHIGRVGYMARATAD